MNFLSVRVVKIIGLLGAALSSVLLVNNGQIAEGVGLVLAALSSSNLRK